jgi:hypothetical protein
VEEYECEGGDPGTGREGADGGNEGEEGTRTVAKPTKGSRGRRNEGYLVRESKGIEDLKEKRRQEASVEI